MKKKLYCLVSEKKNDFNFFYIPDVHVFTSDFLVKFLNGIIRQT